jgi:hypothetical protein
MSAVYLSAVDATTAEWTAVSLDVCEGLRMMHPLHTDKAADIPTKNTVGLGSHHLITLQED